MQASFDALAAKEAAALADARYVTGRTAFDRAACAALDDMGVAYMVGSLAGDDTAFLVMRDTESAASFCEEIKEML